eukprot:scaffold189266_cov52-Attheya_sp.AAC.1
MDVIAYYDVLYVVMSALLAILLLAVFLMCCCESQDGCADHDAQTDGMSRVRTVHSKKCTTIEY